MPNEHNVLKDVQNEPNAPKITNEDEDLRQTIDEIAEDLKDKTDHNKSRQRFNLKAHQIINKNVPQSIAAILKIDDPE